MEEILQSIVNIASYIIVSIGGVGVIILGISSFIGKIWSNQFAEKYRVSFEKDIEKYKSEINSKLNKLDKIEEKALYISKVNYDNEYKIYLEIWPKLIDCVNYTLNLYPMGIEDVPVDENEKEKYKEEKYTKYVESYNNFIFAIEKYAPFYLEEFYNNFNEIKKECFFIGNTYKMYEFDVKYSQSFIGCRDLKMKTEERREIYEKRKKIIELKEKTLLSIRDYLNNLRLNE